jgi:hypothetical protein
LHDAAGHCFLRGKHIAVAVDSKRKAFEAILKKLEKLLPHLGNDNEGEANAARRKINDLLRSKNLDWHDLIALMSEQKESIIDLLSRLVEKDADALVRLGRQDAEFFHTTNGGAVADVLVDGCRQTWPLTSAEFSEWLLHKFYQEKQKAPVGSAVQAAVRTLGAHARFEGRPREVHLRTAEVGGKVYIDLADVKGHVL